VLDGGLDILFLREEDLVCGNGRFIWSKSRGLGGRNFTREYDAIEELKNIKRL